MLLVPTLDGTGLKQVQLRLIYYLCVIAAFGLLDGNLSSGALGRESTRSIYSRLSGLPGRGQILHTVLSSPNLLLLGRALRLFVFG